MKKKIGICTMVFILIMLIASTALADGTGYNGNATHYFTTHGTVDVQNINWAVLDNCDACYVTIGGVKSDSTKQEWLVDSNGNTESAKILILGKKYEQEMDPTIVAVLHAREYNYEHYNNYSMHTEGYLYTYYN